MRRHPGLYFLMVIAGAFVIGAALAGCAPDKSAPEFTPSDEAVVEPTVSSDSVVEDSLDTVMDGTAVADATFTDFICLDCHTNQELLQDLAVEEEATESLSEGPG